MPTATHPPNVRGPPPHGVLGFFKFWGPLLFKAWLTPQRLCGCKPSRRR